MIQVIIQNLQKKIPLNNLQIRKISRIILKQEQLQQGNLSLVFVTHQKMRALNKQFLNRTYLTDVLSFDLSEPDGNALAGEVIISTDQAVKNARTFKSSIAHELALYIVHGILHLNGYDDHKPEDIQKMRVREDEIMKVLGSSINKIIKS